MSKASGWVALLDANVLYPAPVRDFLLHLAATGIYQPKWTSEIHDEWIRNLLLARTDLKAASLKSAVKAMNGAFPDADIINYEDLIPGLNLPDKDDRHVLAAAIRGKANLIVTENIKDFPSKYLQTFDINACSADDFVLQLVDIDKASVQNGLAAQVKNLRNPPQSLDQVLATLERCGMKKSVAELK